MMGYVILFVVVMGVNWASLMITLPIMARLLDFAMPELTTALWQVAVVAAVVTISAFVIPDVFCLGFLVRVGIFCVATSQWFQMSYLQAMITSVVASVVALGLLILALMSLAGLVGGLAA